jgi:hypothetical protein
MTPAHATQSALRAVVWSHLNTVTNGSSGSMSVARMNVKLCSMETEVRRLLIALSRLYTIHVLTVITLHSSSPRGWTQLGKESCGDSGKVRKEDKEDKEEAQEIREAHAQGGRAGSGLRVDTWVKWPL